MSVLTTHLERARQEARELAEAARVKDSSASAEAKCQKLSVLQGCRFTCFEDLPCDFTEQLTRNQGEAWPNAVARACSSCEQ